MFESLRAEGWVFESLKGGGCVFESPKREGWVFESLKGEAGCLNPSRLSRHDAVTSQLVTVTSQSRHSQRAVTKNASCHYRAHTAPPVHQHRATNALPPYGNQLAIISQSHHNLTSNLITETARLVGGRTGGGIVSGGNAGAHDPPHNLGEPQGEVTCREYAVGASARLVLREALVTHADLLGEVLLLPSGHPLSAGHRLCATM